MDVVSHIGKQGDAAAFDDLNSVGDRVDVDVGSIDRNNGWLAEVVKGQVIYNLKTSGSVSNVVDATGDGDRLSGARSLYLRDERIGRVRVTRMMHFDASESSGYQHQAGSVLNGLQVSRLHLRRVDVRDNRRRVRIGHIHGDVSRQRIGEGPEHEFGLPPISNIGHIVCDEEVSCRLRQLDVSMQLWQAGTDVDHMQPIVLSGGIKMSALACQIDKGST